MSDVRIIIATTQNPTTVQRITEEDPVVSSVVCLSGKAVALPISSSYDAFVRNPTGVIQRHFGHAAYRVDVSSTIDEGYSWQLGLFIAHALQKADRLSTLGNDCQRTVITTGEVDRDLNVLGVSGNKEKIETLRPHITSLLEAEHPLSITVPTENVEQWIAAFQQELSDASGHFEILSVQHINQVLKKLDLPAAQAAQTNLPVGSSSKEQNRTPWLAILLFVAIAAGAVTGGVSYGPEIKQLSAGLIQNVDQFVNSMLQEVDESPGEQSSTMAQTPFPTPPAAPSATRQETPKPTGSLASAAVIRPQTDAKIEVEILTLKIPAPQKKPVPPAIPIRTTEQLVTHDTPKPKDVLPIVEGPATFALSASIELSELRAPVGFSCTDARQMQIQAQVRPTSLGRAIRLLGKANDRLCTIEISATVKQSSGSVFGRYQRWTQGNARKREPDKVIDLGPREGGISWSVDVPNRLQRPAIFQVLILSSEKPFELTPKLLKQLDKVRPGNDSLAKLRNKLRKSGIQLTTKRFRVLPSPAQNGNLSRDTLNSNLTRSRRRNPPPTRD